MHNSGFHLLIWEFHYATDSSKEQLGVICSRTLVTAEGTRLPIRKHLSGATFGPETISNMTTAFERIRKILKLDDPGDPLVEVIAKKVISLASQGIFDPKEIERLVIADTKHP